MYRLWRSDYDDCGDGGYERMTILWMVEKGER